LSDDKMTTKDLFKMGCLAVALLVVSLVGTAVMYGFIGYVGWAVFKWLGGTQ
jgi:hypothetical protein